MDETWDRVKNGGGGWCGHSGELNVALARLENICFLWNFVRRSCLCQSIGWINNDLQ